MKILAIKPQFIFPSNGGEISLIENLSELKRRGHDVSAHAFYSPRQTSVLKSLIESEGGRFLGDDYEVRGLRVCSHLSADFEEHDLEAVQKFSEAIGGFLNKENPDEVWVHYTDFLATVAAIRWNTNRVFVRFTDNEYPRAAKLAEFPSIAETYSKIKNAQVASTFMKQALIAESAKLEIRILPNWISQLDRMPQATPGEEFLFVNPVPVKGLEFMLELAKELSHEKFLFVGNWMDEKPSTLLPNIRYLPRQPDISKLFSGVKALLMPSHWQEAFGRLPLEAMAAGVPVITSDRGNLPETVGAGGQVLPLDLASWTKVIRRLEDDAHVWRTSGHQRVRDYRQTTSKIWTSYFGSKLISEGV